MNIDPASVELPLRRFNKSIPTQRESLRIKSLVGREGKISHITSNLKPLLYSMLCIFLFGPFVLHISYFSHNGEIP